MKKDIMLMLAPMAGYTDRHFRRICAEYGADLAVTEMVISRYDKAQSRHSLGKNTVSANVVDHSVGDLDHSADIVIGGYKKLCVNSVCAVA